MIQTSLIHSIWTSSLVLKTSLDFTPPSFSSPNSFHYISSLPNISIVCLIQTKLNHFLKMLSMVSTSYNHLLFHHNIVVFHNIIQFHFTCCLLSNHSSLLELNHSLPTSSKISQISSHYIHSHHVIKGKSLWNDVVLFKWLSLSSNEIQTLPSDVFKYVTRLKSL